MVMDGSGRMQPILVGSGECTEMTFVGYHRHGTRLNRAAIRVRANQLTRKGTVNFGGKAHGPVFVLFNEGAHFHGVLGRMAHEQMTLEAM